MKDYPLNVHSVSPVVRDKCSEHVWQRKKRAMADDKQSWQRSGWHGGGSKRGRSYASHSPSIIMSRISSVTRQLFTFACALDRRVAFFSIQNVSKSSDQMSGCTFVCLLPLL